MKSLTNAFGAWSFSFPEVSAINKWAVLKPNFYDLVNTYCDGFPEQNLQVRQLTRLHINFSMWFRYDDDSLAVNYYRYYA